jgi:hypothetical protein
MEQVQLKTKNGRYITGESVIYTGNFAILQTKEVRDGKMITNHQMFSMEDVQSVSIIREAEVRPLPKTEILHD